jgi:YHS domain-containing protein
MIVRLLIWAVLGYLLYTVIKTATASLRAPRQTPPPERSRRGETMERDPQCGTYVPRGDAVPAMVRGTELWFCSTRCRDEYLKKH